MMKRISFKSFAQPGIAYRIGVFLSSLSLAFGLLREFLIVGILGFTATNDRLQIYLSIFYTIGLSIDAMRLSCLNLYTVLSLRRLLGVASIIALPFSTIMAIVLCFAIKDLDIFLLLISILGSYLNLIAALLITYLQRHNLFLIAQVINVMPNFILIPGILICYWLPNVNLIFAIVCLTTLIPIAQCGILLILARHQPPQIHTNLSLSKSLLTFLRHFAAMSGEQLFQVIARRAFYASGTGYLSVYAIAIRIYSAFRFILIDSFIGSKLASWQKETAAGKPSFSLMRYSVLLAIFIAVITLLMSLLSQQNLIYSSLEMIIILACGFYFSTLVRIIYFKINHQENNHVLVTQFAAYELICAFCAFLLTKQLNYPILALLWLGYIAKPFAQLLLLRNKHQGLEPVKDFR